MSCGDCWHTVTNRVGWVKACAFLGVFAILYAIALSSFINTANQTLPDATFDYPKLKKGQSSDSDNTDSNHFAGTLYIFLLAVDPHLNAVTFAYNFTPSKQFLGTDPDDEETAAELKYHTLFTFGSFVIPQFSKGTEAYGTQTRFPNTVTANGIYAYYPTDTYSLKNVPVTCRYSNATDDSDSELTLTARTPAAISPKCSFGLNVRSGIRTTFAMEVVDKTGSTPQNTANGVSYELSLDIVRPFMFRLYPGFVIFAFWLIILFELLLIFSLSFFEFRKAEFGNVAMFSGLIFALPSFRNSMPLAPPFGSLCDWISFFWAESFAIIGLFILGFKYLIEQPASKNSGLSWLQDVLCPAIAPRPEKVAPSGA